MKNDMKVIGVFANKGLEAICIEEDSCLIAGSQEKMEGYIKEKGKADTYQIRKTRYGEIMRGINMGASYSFDEESYERFYKYGKMDGLDLEEWNKEESARGKKYITIRTK